MATFTRRTQTFVEATGLNSETTSTIPGEAVQVRGTASTYQRLGLSESDAPTLLFSPTSYNLRAQSAQFVLPGDEITWAGAKYLAKDVSPIAPDGFVIAARIVIQRGG